MRVVIIMLAAAALAGCGITTGTGPLASVGTVVSGGPVVIADRTILDETTASTIELAYKGARLLAELAVDTGKVKGSDAARLQALNREAFAGVKAVRLAYRSGNSANWQTTYADAKAAIAEISSIVERN